MDMERRLDKDQAINCFLNNHLILIRLPLISDDEMANLYGEEVISALAEVDEYGRSEGFCRDCRERCCSLISCELYSTELKKCPIQPYRPVLCRMHFCNRFSEKYRMLVKEIGDIFLDGLLTAEKMGSKIIHLFDTPPLGKYMPEMTVFVSKTLQEIKSGNMTEIQGLEMIHAEAEKFRLAERIS